MKPPSMVLDADVNGFGPAKGKRERRNKSGKKVLFLNHVVSESASSPSCSNESIPDACNDAVAYSPKISLLRPHGTPMNNTIPCAQTTTTNSRLGVRSKRKKQGEPGDRRDGAMKTGKETVVPGVILARVLSTVKMKSVHTKKVFTNNKLNITHILM